VAVLQPLASAGEVRPLLALDAFLALWIVFAVVPAMLPPEGAQSIVLFLNLVFLGLQIWLGIKGNEMTAKNLLENGWEFTDPGSDAVQFARLKWGLPIPHDNSDRTNSLAQPLTP
jgi:hypothetical protein